MKIGYFGADGHGKTTTMLAMIKQQMQSEKPLHMHVPYQHHEEFLEALKEKEVQELVAECFKNGGRVDLGCDPGMTAGGRFLQKAIREIRDEVTQGE